MIISTRHGFVFLCMPKCASTSVESALVPYANITVGYPPGLKHTNFREYERFLLPYLQYKKSGQLETVCLFRDPISWLHSWWRYRQRDVPALAKKVAENSTADMTFDEFVLAYMSDAPPKSAQIGTQSKFVLDKNGGIGVDHIFKYEEMSRFLDFIEGKIGKKVELPALNQSPLEQAPKFKDSSIEARVREFLSQDYEIYNSVGS